MDVNSVLNDLLKLVAVLLPVIIPIMVPFVMNATAKAFALLPNSAKPVLKEAAKTAVFAVEQLSSVGEVGLSDAERKSRAKDILEVDLASLHIPDVVIDAAIDEAVLMLKLLQGKAVVVPPAPAPPTVDAAPSAQKGAAK